MVATHSEIKKIMSIMGEYFPATLVEPMLEDIWREVGESTENQSLKSTILRMLKYVKMVYK